MVIVHLIQMNQAFKNYTLCTSVSPVKMVIAGQNIKDVTMVSGTCTPTSSTQQK